MEDSKAFRVVNDLAADAGSLRPNIPGGVGDAFLPIVQEQGDLLLIPSQWYHQTFAPEPSVAVASQRCGSWEARRVVDHILALQDTTTVPIPPELLQASYKVTDARETVKSLFEYLEEVRLEGGA
jgi:hypothetical protein